MQSTLRKLLLVLPLLIMFGCAAHVVHPGTANSFDSDSYDALLITNNTIVQTKASLAAGSFPPAIAGNVKTALNALIKVYDDADTAYLAYHNAAMAGTATTAQSSAVTAGLSNVSSATTNLTNAKGAK
jgi:hypothetical protein